jgi:hypothetical protein
LAAAAATFSFFPLHVNSESEIQNKLVWELENGIIMGDADAKNELEHQILFTTPSIPNYKSFQEIWRVKASQV